MTTNKRGLLPIIFIAAIGASMGVAGKIGVEDVPPLGFIAARVILSLILIIPLLIKTKFFNTRYKIKLFAFSTLATANITLFILGIGSTNVSVAAALYTATPLLTAIFSRLFYQESIGLKKLIGIIIGLVGASIIVLAPAVSNTFNTGSISGNLIISAAVIFFSLHTAISKKIQKYFSPAIITQAFIITASLILLPLAIWEITTTGFWISDLYLKPILAMIYISTVGTVGFYFLYQRIIKRASSLIASLIMYLQPIFAVIFGIIIFNETLTVEFIVGTLLTFIGVWIITSTQKKAVIIEEAKARG